MKTKGDELRPVTHTFAFRCTVTGSKTHSLLTYQIECTVNFSVKILYSNALTFKRRTFETAVALAGRSLFKCPLLLCQFLLEGFH
jgi:hypothetical protein